MDLHTLTNVETIAIPKGKEDKVEGITITVVNTGGGVSFLEMLGDFAFATNRTHRIASGESKCSKECCPGGPEGREIEIRKAEKITFGRLLVKAENRLENERILTQQGVAYSTERTITTPSGQKSIIEEWEEKGRMLSDNDVPN